MISFQFGSLTVYAYGLTLALGTILALLLMAHLPRGKQLRPGALSWFALTGIPLALLSARLLYVLVSITWFIDQEESYFAFTHGGYMLYGAMAGLALAAFISGRITKEKPARFLDAAAAPFAFFVFTARSAEYFAGVGLGEDIEAWFDPFMERTYFPTEDPSFFLRFPFGVKDPYGYWCFPVFLLEAAAALILFVILLRAAGRRDGTLALKFLALYAGLQTFLESLRVDLELRWGFVKINQLMVLPALAVIIVCCILRTPKENRRASLFLPYIIGALLGCGVVMAMEFALEEKIGFLTWMRSDLCWLMMGLGALLIALSAYRLICRTDTEASVSGSL